MYTNIQEDEQNHTKYAKLERQSCIPFTFQPDIAASGGLSEFLKISAIASTFGVGWSNLSFASAVSPSLIRLNFYHRDKFDQYDHQVNIVPHVWCYLSY